MNRKRCPVLSVNVRFCPLDSIFQGFIIKLEKLSAGTASVCFFIVKRGVAARKGGFFNAVKGRAVRQRMSVSFMASSCRSF